MKCINCELETKNPKYCSLSCQQLYQHKQKISSWLNDGKKPDIRLVRRYLKETINYECSICKISTWNNTMLTLEIEHKDGNSDNNKIDNICWICPNCHSQTDTYKGKNKGNGRHFRMIRYHAGKSY